MGKLAQRFLDPQKSGVYRVTDANVSREAAREAGLALLEVPLDGVADKDALLRRFRDSLAFPAWFGANWDALEDCLTDLSWRPAAGYVLLPDGIDKFAARSAGDYRVLIEVLGGCADSWRERGVPFFAVCADSRAALALPALFNEAA